MGWIEVAIPGVFGLLFVVAPKLFTKSTRDKQKNASNVVKFRGIGVLLLAVAGGCLFIKLASGR